MLRKSQRAVNFLCLTKMSLRALTNEHRNFLNYLLLRSLVENVSHIQTTFRWNREKGVLYLISAFYGPLCLFIASTDQLRKQFTVAVILLKDSVYQTRRNHFKEVLPRRNTVHLCTLSLYSFAVMESRSAYDLINLLHRFNIPLKAFLPFTYSGFLSTCRQTENLLKSFTIFTGQGLTSK